MLQVNLGIRTMYSKKIRYKFLVVFFISVFKDTHTQKNLY